MSDERLDEEGDDLCESDVEPADYEITSDEDLPPATGGVEE